MAAQRVLRQGARRLPDFIGVGPAHAGSTWLHWVLKGHVGLPHPKKETHFFDWHYDRGLDWYADRFAHNREDQPIGEICNYFPSRLACERIALHIPDCRIVCSLRDPVERAYSAYKFAIYNGLTHDSFELALETNRSMIAGNLYSRHLSDWYAQFGKDRVLVVLFDDMLSAPQAYMDKVCDFIGITRIDVHKLRLPAKAVNSHSRIPRNPTIARKARRAINWLRDHDLNRAMALLNSTGIWNLFFAGPFPPMSSEIEARLRERYIPEIEGVERLTGLDLSRWKMDLSKRHHEAGSSREAVSTQNA